MVACCATVPPPRGGLGFALCWVQMHMQGIFAVVIAVVAAARVSTNAERVYPGASWSRRSASEAGFDPEGLQAAMDYAAAMPGLTDLNCASVHRDGYLVAEVSAEGRDPLNTTTIFSTSKPVVASLLGALQRDGLVSSMESRASEFIEEWASTPSAEVTLDQLLRHDSGRFFYDWYLDAEFSQSMPSQTAYALVLAQMHAPGTTYAYNQMAFQSLERVLVKAAGTSVPELTKREIWGPLKFESDTFWWAEGFEWPPNSGLPGPPTDPIVCECCQRAYRCRAVCLLAILGAFCVACLSAHAHTVLVDGGMTTSCRDVARFCHLWLQRGQWADDHTVFSGTLSTCTAKRIA
jgi:CubicO group peptidase (beta-lactamase class C family)